MRKIIYSKAKDVNRCNVKSMALKLCSAISLSSLVVYLHSGWYRNLSKSADKNTTKVIDKCFLRLPFS
jgi:hypothetical protein